MIISRDEALNILGLPTASPNVPSEIEAAFARLTRRYPPAAFPERFARLLAARDALSHRHDEWLDLATSDKINMAWIAPYIPADDTRVRTDHELQLDLLRVTFGAPSDIPESDDGDEQSETGDFDLEDLEAMLGELVRRTAPRSRR